MEAPDEEEEGKTGGKEEETVGAGKEDRAEAERGVNERGKAEEEGRGKGMNEL